ncbi:MAG: hypothetical protein HY722_11760 [Planctomycetes bacterium]|nr:hypothetical protein [Planctomycetota bacterium]
MARKRTSTRPEKHGANGAGPFYAAMTAAYRDAIYQTAVDELYDEMRDERIRTIIRRFAHELADALREMDADEVKK